MLNLLKLPEEVQQLVTLKFSFLIMAQTLLTLGQPLVMYQ